MKKRVLAIIVIKLLCLTGCGGGSSVDATSAASSSCNDAPVLGQTTFGTGCFK